MSRWTVVLGMVAAVAVAFTASANLLLNPGYETEGGGGPTEAANWWKYNNAGREGWAARSGSYGMSFWSWDNGAWGGFGQDVASNVAVGAVLTFSVYGKAEQNYQSSTAETWLKIEYWNGGSLLGSDTLDVYGLMTGNRENWNLATFITTNTFANVTTVKPIVGGGGFTNNNVARQAMMWDDAGFTIGDAIPEPTIAGLLGFAGLLIAALRRKATKK